MVRSDAAAGEKIADGLPVALRLEQIGHAVACARYKQQLRRRTAGSLRLL